MPPPIGHMCCLLLIASESLCLCVSAEFPLDQVEMIDDIIQELSNHDGRFVSRNSFRVQTVKILSFLEIFLFVASPNL